MQSSAVTAGGRPSKLKLAQEAAARDSRQLKFTTVITTTLNNRIKATTTVEDGVGTSSSSNQAGKRSFTTYDVDDDDDEYIIGGDDAYNNEEYEGANDDENDYDGDDEDRVSEEPAHSSAAAGPSQKKARGEYSDDEKRMILNELHTTHKGNYSACERWLSTQLRWKSVTRKMMRSWQVSKAKSKPGRKVDTDFEKSVLSRLIFTVLESTNDRQRARVVANVAHSYDVIRRAALDVQKQPGWSQAVQNLKISDGWISLWLKRQVLRRRRVTAADKQRPPVDEVQAHMQAIQQRITAGGYTLDDIISYDETGVFFGAPPKNQYVPQDAERATAADADSKVRFTAGLWATASGKMGPPFFIIKCSKKSMDLASTRVIDNLHLQKGFRSVDGWSLCIWQRTLTLIIKGKSVTGTYRRPYLVSRLTGAVITCQHRAWMDTPGLCMMLDTVFKPWMQANKRRPFIVWDNCGPHLVDAVKQTLAELGIASDTLPKNMTDILQVMDLVVNGPLKAGVRSERADALYDYFQTWRFKVSQAQVAGVAAPRFAPPKTTLEEGLRFVLETNSVAFTTEAFQDGIRRAFVKVGLAPTDNAGYVNYTGSVRGSVPAVLAPADSPDDDRFVIGDVMAELQLDDDGAEDDEDEFEDEEDDPRLVLTDGGVQRLQPAALAVMQQPAVAVVPPAQTAAATAQMPAALAPVPVPSQASCRCCNGVQVLPPGWKLSWSKTQSRHYYYRPETNISQFELPKQ